MRINTLIESHLLRLSVALIVLGISAFRQLVLHRFRPYGWGIGGILLRWTIPWSRPGKYADW